MAATGAAMTIATIGILQTDYISRKYLLSPIRLQRKRCQTYSYTWKHKILEYTKLQLNYFLVGGKDKISDYNTNPKILDKNYTEYISSKDTEGMEQLIQKILDKTKKGGSKTYRIVKIDQDVEDPTNEYYLYLMEEEQEKRGAAPQDSKVYYDVTKLVLYQVPLIEFCTLLREELDNIISTVTFCFVADASSNRGYDFIYDMCEKSCKGTPNFQIGMVKEPFWLLNMGSIIDDRSILNKQIIETILYCCCRLESTRLENVGVVQQSKTVVITLSGGQAMTHLLLPYIYRVFPQDRHVFCYDSCITSVQRTLLKMKSYKQGIVPASIDDATSMKGNSSMTISTPYYSPTSIQLIKSSVVYKIRLLLSALSKLSIQHASIVECWITSVDTFLRMKEDYGDENKKIQCPYLPYVMQWNQIIDRKNLSSYIGIGPNTTEEEKKCDTYWVVRSLLQYITGCKSRPLPDGILETAMSYVLLDVIHNEEQSQQDAAAYCKLSKQQLKDIENCCFQHKSILIENKTLPDTVYPKQHWTLKQNLKRGGGCACCGPEDYLNDDEDEEEDERQDDDGANGFGGSTKPSSASMMRDDGTLDMSVPGAFAMAFQPQQQTSGGSTLTNRRRGGGGSGGGEDAGTNNNGSAGAASSSATEANKRPKFVDGKLGFAFDPTKFS